MSYPKSVLSGPSVDKALNQIAREIAMRNEDAGAVALVGIQRGGAPIAVRLKDALERIWGFSVPFGLLDVSMHRDDHSQRLPGNIQPTDIPFDPAGKTVVLVDDVLFSGRTVRAALDALTDLGRPKAIQLAVLIDRGNRELPIKADYVGLEVAATLQERVVVHLREKGAEADDVIVDKL